MSMLDSRSLLKFASCHKRFLPIVSYDRVVSVAVATESRDVHFIIERIKHHAVKKSEIFMPSPARLLRLINGIRCELCQKNNVSTAVCGSFCVLGARRPF